MSEFNSLALFTLMNSVKWSMAPLFSGSPLRGATCGIAVKLVDPTIRNHFFFLYQTVICVDAGKPHPQPHYQSAS